MFTLTENLKFKMFTLTDNLDIKCFPCRCDSLRTEPRSLNWVSAKVPTQQNHRHRCWKLDV